MTKISRISIGVILLGKRFVIGLGGNEMKEYGRMEQTDPGVNLLIQFAEKALISCGPKRLVTENEEAHQRDRTMEKNEKKEI